MFDTDTVADEVRELILDVCEVLHNHGYQEVSIGAIMRLIGIDAGTASAHDDSGFALDETFEEILRLRHGTDGTVFVSNKTLH